MQFPIIWQSTFNVDIQVIDEQHQHLIEIINRLSTEVETTVGAVELTDFFRELVNYSEYHFQTEEAYFNRYAYPERDQHLAAHASYRQTLETFLIREGSREEVAKELLAFLGQWWVEHITGTDQTLRGLASQ